MFRVNYSFEEWYALKWQPDCYGGCEHFVTQVEASEGVAELETAERKNRVDAALPCMAYSTFSVQHSMMENILFFLLEN